METVYIFTDGGAIPNDSRNTKDEAKAGYAVYIANGQDKGTIYYGSLEKKDFYPTNIRAEGFAILNVLEYISKSTDSNFTIVTDSQFWIDMLSKWMPKWSETKFLKQQNSDLTLKLAKLWKSIKVTKNVGIQHMYSHDKSKWSKRDKKSFEYICYVNNDVVDNLAGLALELKKGTNYTGHVKITDNVEKNQQRLKNIVLAL